MDSHRTTISVVICAYDLGRWDELVAAVQSVWQQTLPPAETIVVVDHNEELRRRAVQELQGVTVLANQLAKGLSGARNTGVRAVTSEVVAFLDDDARADGDWLEHLSVPLNDPTVAGVGGWIVPVWEKAPPAWFPETFYWVVGCSFPGLPPTNARLRNPMGANMAMRRQVFSRIGGFTTGLGRVGTTPLGCEETELSIRYTSRFPEERFVMVREAVVRHSVPASRLTWHYFWNRCWDEGISKAAVSSLVGSGSALASEWRYVLRSLPLAVLRCLRSMPQHPLSTLGQIGAITIGTACATAGLLRGRLAFRSNPIRPDEGIDAGDFTELDIS